MNRKNPRTIPENRESPKKDKKGRTSPDRETPPFETPPFSGPCPEGPKIKIIRDFERVWKFRAKMKFSSEPPTAALFLWGKSRRRDWNFWARLKISIEIEHVERDWMFFDRWARWVIMCKPRFTENGQNRGFFFDKRDSAAGSLTTAATNYQGMLKFRTLVTSGCVMGLEINQKRP